MKNLFLILFITLAYELLAQDHQKYLIACGKLYNSETGDFKAGMVILVTNNKIDTVKAEKELSTNERLDYKLIDLSKHTVLPGLLDCHTHLLFKEVLYPDNNLSGLDMGKTLVFEGDSLRALYGAARAKAYLEAGITSIQDLGNSGQFGDVALRRVINEGLLPGPRMLVLAWVCQVPGAKYPE